MSKKELRKELELVLVKTIESVLSKKDALIAPKIRKTTAQASKDIAKKFYKSLKSLQAKKTNKSMSVKKNISKKSVIKKAKK